MNKETFDKLLNQLKGNSYNYSFDYYFDRGITVMRGLFLNTDENDHLKNHLDKYILREVKLRKTYIWNLGEKKKAIYMKFKDEFEMEIPDLEAYDINTYA